MKGGCSNAEQPLFRARTILHLVETPLKLHRFSATFEKARGKQADPSGLALSGGTAHDPI